MHSLNVAELLIHMNIIYNMAVSMILDTHKR